MLTIAIKYYYTGYKIRYHYGSGARHLQLVIIMSLSVLESCVIM